MTDSVQPESGSRAFRWRLFALCFALLSPPAEAGWFRALEPHHLTREPGPPSSVRLPFEVLDPSLPYRVRIFNGGASGTGEPIASAVVRLNGQRIFGPVAFRRAGRGTLDKAVALRSSNLLAIRIFGHRGTMTVLVLGRDDGAPIIEARVTPPANAAGWHNADDVAAGGVTVEFDCSDAESGIDSCSEPVVLDTEGTAQVVTGTAIDLAGNVATASAVVNLDVTPPMIGVVEPVDGATTGVEVPTEGSIVDDLSGVAFAEVDGSPLALSASGDFAQTIGVPAGLHTLMYTAEDVAGNRADVQVDIEAVGSSGVEVEFLSPGPDTIQYGSGWPLTLRVTVPEEMVGIGVKFKLDNLDDDLRLGPFPQEDEIGFVVLNDADFCPSNARFTRRDACQDLPIQYNDMSVDWWIQCNFEPLPQNETLIQYRPRVDEHGDDPEMLPALVVVSDTGTNLRVEGGKLKTAANIAAWNSVSYQLKDSRHRTSITAHMNIEAGTLWPRVEYEVTDIIDQPSGSSTGTGWYRIDGGLRGCLEGDDLIPGEPPYCRRQTPITYDFSNDCLLSGRPIEGRMENLYIPIFEGSDLNPQIYTLRAFLVELDELDPLDKLKDLPCEIENFYEDDRIDEADTFSNAEGRFFRGKDCKGNDRDYRLISNVAEIRFRQHFGAPCQHGMPGEIQRTDLNESDDPDDDNDNNGIEDFSEGDKRFCNTIPESSPVGASEPPR